MAFLDHYRRRSDRTAPLPPSQNGYACLTEQDVRRIAAEVLRRYVKRNWFGDVEIEAPPATPPLTLAQIRKMSREEIMQRWDEVEYALQRSR